MGEECTKSHSCKGVTNFKCRNEKYRLCITGPMKNRSKKSGHCVHQKLEGSCKGQGMPCARGGGPGSSRCCGNLKCTLNQTRYGDKIVFGGYGICNRDSSEDGNESGDDVRP